VQHFDRQRDALAAADAEGDKAAGEAVPTHRVDKPRVEHRARRADRVAMGDSAPFDVDDVLGQSELAGKHDGDGRERLIDLDALNGADVPAGACESRPPLIAAFCLKYSDDEQCGFKSARRVRGLRGFFTLGAALLPKGRRVIPNPHCRVIEFIRH